MWGIYKLTFPNGKCYIGQSTNLKRRMKDYDHWEKRCKGQKALYKAINKYGIENVERTFLFQDGGKLDLDKLNDLEVSYIKEYNSLVPNGYNIQPGGDNMKHAHVRIDLMQALIPYYDEPIIDTETNVVYDDMEDWARACNKGHIDDWYNLFLDNNNRYKFVNEATLKYPLGDGTVPPNQTIKAVHDRTANRVIFIPVGV